MGKSDLKASSRPVGDGGAGARLSWGEGAMRRRMILAGAWLGNGGAGRCLVGEGGTAAKDVEVADRSEVKCLDRKSVV